MSTPVILLERHGPVLTVTLNRPERSNAWTRDMELGYGEALASAERDPAVRAVVVTGAGSAFCVGADLDLLSGTEPGAIAALLPDRRWEAFPPFMTTPVVAAVNGSAAGVGLAVALACDVRVVAEQARLSTAFTRRGLIAEHATSWLLPQLVGRGRALDLLLSGRAVSGVEAGGIGLAEFVVPAEEVLPAALTYARDLAERCSPTAMAVVKAQLRLDSLDPPRSATERADRLMRASFGRADVVEGVASYLEGRLPVFPPVDPTALSELDPG